MTECIVENEYCRKIGNPDLQLFPSISCTMQPIAIAETGCVSLFMLKRSNSNQHAFGGGCSKESGCSVVL